MTMHNLWTELKPVHINMPAGDILDHFANAGAPSFLPVVDKSNVPLGIIREQELKSFIYSHFGRELLKRRRLSDFLVPCPVLDASVTVDDLLSMAAEKEDPEGVIFTENRKYRAVLFGGALLKIFGKHHLDMQVRVAQLQKMDAIGTLAGGIAHDLNNLLTPIVGCAEIAMEMVKKREVPDSGLLQDIYTCAMRASETVRRIQSFSRHQTTERRVVHLRHVIEESVRLLETSLPKTLNLRVSFDTGSDTILGNDGELLQVLMNLCSNAAHAMNGKSGDIAISLSRHSGELPGWNLRNEPLVGDYVRLTVRDKGCGIAQEVLPQVFMPFFTTKKQGEGTGMGLAVVHGIVSRGGGFISVESEVGQGTSFHIVWPVQHVAGAQHDPRALPPEVYGKDDCASIRVVVVDDEPAITRLAQVALSRHGYDVVAFTDSLAAICAIENENLQYDFLILDQMMPNLTGIELARRALLLHPEIPIMMCTGFSVAVSPEDARRVGLKALILKPVNFNEIAECIKRETGLRRPVAA